MGFKPHHGDASLRRQNRWPPQDAGVYSLQSELELRRHATVLFVNTVHGRLKSISSINCVCQPTNDSTLPCRMVCGVPRHHCCASAHRGSALPCVCLLPQHHVLAAVLAHMIACCTYIHCFFIRTHSTYDYLVHTDTARAITQAPV